MSNLKEIIRTVMVATIVTFWVVTWSHYHTLAEEGISLPKFEHTNDKQFLHNVKQCVHHVYYHNDIEKVNLEVLLAQAALESSWGNSRFAREGKNLFGIRTYDLREPHMLPSNEPKEWGVKVYKHECDSVLNYINILNNGKGFSEYRKLREKGITDPFRFTETLGAYATDKDYFAKIKDILIKIRKNY